jgi:hypothetical protein
LNTTTRKEMQDMGLLWFSPPSDWNWPDAATNQIWSSRSHTVGK